MAKMSEALCKGCMKPIVWGRDEKGKVVPLDPKPPVYCVVDTAEPDETGVQSVMRVKDCFVSHFATCPNANDFSGSKKKSERDAL